MSGYSSARITKELIEKAEKFIADRPEMKYRSISEFVNNLLRKEIDRLKMKVSSLG
ncbi:MAG: hypothetical protein QXV17_06625 [Candidatus Micrarchaeaceae archaeon]